MIAGFSSYIMAIGSMLMLIQITANTYIEYDQRHNESQEVNV